MDILIKVQWPFLFTTIISPIRQFSATNHIIAVAQQ